ncbi:MAG: hypothetical protein IJC93_01100 [Clostridia bacterium]|nr:hypothetical protein [Clostridia bacterium]
MKDTLRNIIMFVLSAAFFSLVYINAFKVSATAVAVSVIFLTLYGICIGLSQKSAEKLKHYEQKQIHFGLCKRDDRRILLFSLTTLSPMFLCIFLVSLIPLYTYEIWLITVLPAIVLNCIPAIGVLGEYYGLTRKRLPYILLCFLFTMLFCLVGVILSAVFLKSL